MSESSLNINQLALMNLRRKPGRSLGLAALTGIFAAFLFGGSVIKAELQQGLQTLSQRMGADILIVPRGYDKSAQALILRGEPSTFYMRADILEKIRQTAGVQQATPQYFLSSFESDCCDSKVQFIGYDPESDFMIRPWMGGQPPAVKTGEIVVGARIFAQPGDRLLFFGENYRVAAQLEATGLGLDTSIFVPLAALYDIIRGNGTILTENDGAENYISAVAVKVSPEYQPRQVGMEIMRRYIREYNLELVETSKMVVDLAKSLQNLALAVYGAAAFLWLQAVLVLGLVFSVTLHERKREFSLFRVLGASRRWLRALMLREAVFIGLGGTLLGITLASLLVFPFSHLIFQNIGLPHLDIGAGLILFYGLVTLVIAGSSGVLACVHTAWSLSKTEVYGALREGE